MPRDLVLGVFRRHLARIQQQVRDEFETYRMAGVEAAQRLTALTDGVVRTPVRARIRRNRRAVPGCRTGSPSPPPADTAAACWRRFSDIDLLFLAPDEPDPVTLRVIEFMLYFMWDLGLKVGHATRSIAHCLADAEDDLTIRTSLIRRPAARRRCRPVRRVPDRVRRGAAPEWPRRVHHPPSRRSATNATAVSVKAPSWSSPTSRKAAAACETCKRCIG